MVHILFDTTLADYDGFQVGSGADATETGGGDPLTYTFYKGSPSYQRGWGIQGGAGLADVLRGFWRFFLPLIRRVGTTVSAEALNTGQRVLDKVVNEGAPIKEALVTEGKRGIDTVLEKGGLPKQFGTGRGRRRRKALPSHQTLIGRAVVPTTTKKRIRTDTFGLY